MELSYRQLEAALAAHFSISPDGLPRFRSRIKQLQRLEFPGGVNVGRGVKMVYGAEHLFKLVIAFELIGLGIPADRATTVVTTHWRALAGALALARRNLLNAWWTKFVFVRLVMRSMIEMQFERGDNKSLPTEAIVEDWEAITENLNNLSLNRRAFAYTVICVSDLFNRVVTGCEDAAIPKPYEDLEIAGWMPSAAEDWLNLKGAYEDGLLPGSMGEKAF